MGSMRLQSLRHGRLASSIGVVLALVGVACGPPGGPIPVYAEAARGADQDADGAADADDACVDQAEDGLPPKANDGCPAVDPDQDGVLLGDDRCPDAKEDGEPPAADGCPAADADADGVADARDKCADKPEDNLGTEPSDGCPAPDGDSDGIPDPLDKCPTQLEAENGFRDDDGCADTVPAGGAAYDDESSEIWVENARAVTFEPDKSDLSGPSKETLANVASVLKEHPEISRLEIEVHTTSVGDPKANAALSEKRARAVVATLAARGVDVGRLVAMGYGEYCPSFDKGDEVLEPKNARVAFKAVVVRGVWRPVPRGCWRAKAAGIDPTKRSHGRPAITVRTTTGG